MSRLLILSSDTGEGHNSAARALEHAGADSGWNVVIRRPLEASAAGNRALASLYNCLLTHRPGWVGLFTHALERFRPNEAEFVYRRFRGYIDRFLEAETPDVLLSVHPMLNHMIQRRVAERRLGIPCHTFVTDPFPPFWKAWVSPYIDRYFVVTAEAADALRDRGVEPDRIDRVSMPLRPGFKPRDPQEVARLRSGFGLDGDTILVNGGARGGGPLPHLVRAVREAAPDAWILVVCGTNDRVRERLVRGGDPRVRTFGFVPDIHSLVGAADLVITKPGAFATYEALASAVPAVLTAVGGLMPQESGMFKAAGRYGFGFAVRTLEELRAVVRQGVTAWRAKTAAIRTFYQPGAAPTLLERIEPSHARS